jgi:thymidylate synthase (FAD)
VTYSIKTRSDVTARLVRASATDAGVVEAARVSTQGAASLDTGDKSTKGLINYLVRDRHGSPFEHTYFTFLVEAPIFVAREHMRHRAGWSYNEESARYKELEGVFYVPGPDRALIQVGKPGAYEFEKGSDLQWATTKHLLEFAYDDGYYAYREALRMGVAREVARMALPVGTFTSYYASCNARSLMHFLSLRTKSADAKFPSFPQREIEMVAEQMETHFKNTMPLTYEAFIKNGRVAP